MMKFDGADYQPTRDNPRLTSQYKRIWAFIKDGTWRTLREIAEDTGDPEASVSAQLRHMRKERFGKHTVERDHVKNGLYVYRLVIREALQTEMQL
jgi:hypothetical protein